MKSNTIIGHIIHRGKCPQHQCKRTRKDAERKLTELVHHLDTEAFVKPTKLTVGEFLQRWLEAYAATHVRSRSLEGYQDRAKHLIEHLGNIPLSDLRPDHLLAYYAEKLVGGRRDGQKGGLSPGTLAKHHNLLREALGHGVRWGLLVRNVADAVPPPHPTPREPTILRPDAIQRFLDAVRPHYLYPLSHTALWTGMRRSELLGLKWGDVDLVLGTISVVRALHQLKDGSFEYAEPKTAKGRRQIALSPSSCLTLRAHRERQELIGLLTTPEALVFCRLDGTPLSPDVITHTFSRLVRKAGSPGVRFHDLRHSHASLLLQLNIHPKVVSERLGHANIQTTLDIYSHVIPGLQERAALRFDEAFSQAAQRTPQPV